jgi:phage gp45-like
VNESELKHFIVKEIQRQVKIITSGAAGDNTSTTETINELYPGMPAIPNRPVMHPYGFASRAPANTISVVAQQGEHPGNRVTLGHRAKDRPDMDEGESVQYSSGGYQVFVKNGAIFVGKNGTLEHMVVGDQLNTFLKLLLDLIVAHTHTGNLGVPTSPPINVADFNEAKAENLTNSKILAKDGGRF